MTGRGGLWPALPARRPCRRPAAMVGPALALVVPAFPAAACRPRRRPAAALEADQGAPGPAPAASSGPTPAPES